MSAQPNPVITNGTATPAQQPPSTGSAKQRRTKLHDVAEAAWHLPPGFWFDDDDFFYLMQFVDPDAVKATKNGFQLANIMWMAANPKVPEVIVGDGKSFDENTAAAMVALARLHGWKSIDIHGSDEQKALLWMALQRQNMLEEEEYNKHPKLDTNGQKIPFEPMSTSYIPPANVMNAWQAEEARHKGKATPTTAAPAAPAAGNTTTGAMPAPLTGTFNAAAPAPAPPAPSAQTTPPPKPPTGPGKGP